MKGVFVMYLAKPVRGLTALALIMVAGMAVADDAAATDPVTVDDPAVSELPVDETQVDPIDGWTGEDDGLITIDFGCFDCNMVPVDDSGVVPGDTGEDETWTEDEATEEDWVEEDWTEEDWSEEDWTEEDWVADDPDAGGSDVDQVDPDPLPGDVPVYYMDGTPRDSDGVIAPNERGPDMLPTSVCGGCEAEGGIAQAPRAGDNDPARHPVVAPHGNICTDPVMYAAWLCAWQGFPRP